MYFLNYDINIFPRRSSKFNQHIQSDFYEQKKLINNYLIRGLMSD
jgi:hypothetical protein